MLCRSRSDFADNAAKTFLNQLFQRPSGTVSGQHGQIMQMNVCISVCIGNFFIINFGKPVVGGDSTGIAQNKTTDGIGDGRIFFNTPVGNLNIAVNNIFIVENGRFHITYFFTLFPIKNICFGNFGVSGLNENLFHTVLNILYLNFSVFNFWLKISSNFQGKKINNIWMIIYFFCFKSTGDGNIDFAQIKFRNFAVTLNNLIHLNAS